MLLRGLGPANQRDARARPELRRCHGVFFPAPTVCVLEGTIMNLRRAFLPKGMGKLALAALGWAAAHLAGSLCAQPQPTPPATGPRLGRDIVAHVNNVPITREELAEELIARKGKQHLELLINRKIIELEAQKEGVTVTAKEIEEDVADVMRGVGAKSPKEFEDKMLRHRNTTYQEYIEDVVRPGILMRKMAEKHVTVTDEDLRKSFEANYGEKVDCRIILIPKESRQLAFKVHAEVRGVKSVEEFMQFARKYNSDQLAATGGQIRPINRHSALGEVERAAFTMHDGEVSHVMEQPEGYVILYRVKLIPADPSAKFDELREMMHREIKRKKTEQMVRTLFTEMKARVTINDYLNNRFDTEQLYRGGVPEAPAPRSSVPDLVPVKP